MAENKPVLPLWLVYPKSASIFWAGIGVYMGTVDPEIRKKLPDTRSRLVWWEKMSNRGRQTILPIGLSSVLVALFAYRETKNNFFLFGSLVSLLSLPFTCIVMGPHSQYLKNKSNLLADGGFLTKRDQETIDAEIDQWTLKHRLRTLIPVIAAVLFVIAERQQLTGKK